MKIKEQIEEIKRRLLRLEVLVWILCGVNGIKLGTDAIPIVSALLNG